MFSLNKSSKIYVVCPAYFKTGGTELAHQLVYEINKINNNAFIVYYKLKEYPLEINPAFKIYLNQFIRIDEIDDNKNNLIILPEINPIVAKNFKNIQKAIWWMSVDNYRRNHELKSCYKNNGLLSTLKKIIKGEILTKKKIFNNSYNHFYQSEYAHQFLIKKGVTNSLPLSDYINQAYLEFKENGERKDYVLFNPKKGIEFTNKIIQASKYLHWIPLENMSTDEVKEMLSKSKVYIDFGYHPGKDRFPREAAISGCCVITGKQGAANYHEDIPIPSKYKFDDKDSQIPKIVDTINECINNYSENQKNFLNYKKFIESEYSIFKDKVKEYFGVKEG